MPPKTTPLSVASFTSICTSARATLQFLDDQAQALRVPPSAEAQPTASALLDVLDREYSQITAQIEAYQHSDMPIPDLEDGAIQAAHLEFVTRYTSLYTLLHKLSSPPNVTAAQSSSQSIRFSNVLHSTASGDSTLVNMPRLSVPSFSGKPSDWEHFFSRFDSLINSNAAFSPLQKFQYLLDALDFESGRLISHLPLTEEHYQAALKILKARYDNPRRAINFHAKALISLPPASIKNREGVSRFKDSLKVHVQALQTIPNVIPYEVYMIADLLSKFDRPLVELFESRYRETNTFPKLQDLLDFLDKITLQWENTELTCEVSSPPTTSCPNEKVHKNTKYQAFISTVKGDSPPSSERAHSRFNTPSGERSRWETREVCVCCSKGKHSLVHCELFKEKTIPDRKNFVYNHKRCWNCLGAHFAQDCSSRRSCFHCRKKHNTLLHQDRTNVPSKHFKPTGQDSKPSLNHESSSSSASEPPIEEPPAATALCFPGAKGTCALLATSFINLECSDSSQTICIRAVVDTAAAASFLTKTCVDVLQAPMKLLTTPLGGLGGARCNSLGTVKLRVKSSSNLLVAQTHTFLVLDHISSNTPVARISPSLRASLTGYTLADPSFDRPAPLDCILGAELAGHIITGPPIILGPKLPTLTPSSLGHLLMGPAPVVEETHPQGNQALFASPIVALHATMPEEACQSNLPEKLSRVSKPLPSSDTHPVKKNFLRARRKKHNAQKHQTFFIKDPPPERVSLRPDWLRTPPRTTNDPPKPSGRNLVQPNKFTPLSFKSQANSCSPHVYVQHGQNVVPPRSFLNLPTRNQRFRSVSRMRTPSPFLSSSNQKNHNGNNFFPFVRPPRHRCASGQSFCQSSDLYFSQNQPRSRWRSDFLPTLQPRSKWLSPGDQLSPGDLVVLHEPSAPPSMWPLGRISKTYPGSDGYVRRVLVNTSAGQYVRPAIKVFKLPIYD